VNQPQAVISVENLTRRFGDFTAVDHISFQAYAGEVLGYLGPNGSGKTTTIRMLLGLLLPSEGSGQVLGYDIVRQTELIRSRVGYMSQKFALYHDLTVLENLVFYGGVYGMRDKKRLDEVLSLVGLHGLERERVSALSVGWKQRVALGTAIIHQPRLLFLDEPTSGVDPNARRSFWDLIYQVVESGVMVLVTTHYMDEAEYCSRVGIMRDGKLLALDTPSGLKEKSLPGKAWDVFAEPILLALQGLAASPIVQHIGLAGDHLRLITPQAVTQQQIMLLLEQIGASTSQVEPVEPSLEDVFLALAGENNQKVG
jgi:ABC-2 type transport system ATP-binding protein